MSSSVQLGMIAKGRFANGEHELADRIATIAKDVHKLEQENAELREALESSVNLLAHTEEYCEGLLGDYEDHELVELGKKLVQQRNSIKQILNK